MPDWTSSVSSCSSAVSDRTIASYDSQFRAALPIAEAPKNPPKGDIAIGKSPGGKALKFVHRGSYDSLDTPYEALTNYLDDKRLEAKDMFIEEYVTDPVGADPNKLVVNVYVLIKPAAASPG